jgi:dTMP kinase
MSIGHFITFEGIDGCGKSTQVSCAVEYLRSQNWEVVATREPGGTPIGEHIRQLLLSPQNSEMVSGCEVLLYFAARSQHVREKIAPALQRGSVVLCDRFSEATFAYQGFGRGFPLTILNAINAFAADNLEPDLTFVFDISVECAHARLKKTGKEPDRLEANAVEFHQRVREGYLALAAAHPRRIVLIPGDRSIEETGAAVRAGIDALLKVNKS